MPTFRVDLTVTYRVAAYGQDGVAALCEDVTGRIVASLRDVPGVTFAGMRTKVDRVSEEPGRRELDILFGRAAPEPEIEEEN